MEQIDAASMAEDSSGSDLGEYDLNLETCKVVKTKSKEDATTRTGRASGAISRRAAFAKKAFTVEPTAFG